MNICIIGAGRVGSVLGRAWASRGHELVFGMRDATGDKANRIRIACGSNTQTIPVAGSAKNAGVVVVATPWDQVQGVLESVGDLAGKIIVDTTNPIIIGADELSRGLLVGHTTSAAEMISQWAPGACVVKAFNTTGTQNMSDPNYGDRRVVSFLCGDDEAAKNVVSGLIADVGLRPVDVGVLKMARYLEPMALMWITLAYGRGWGPDFAFDILQRPERPLGSGGEPH